MTLFLVNPTVRRVTSDLVIRTAGPVRWRKSEFVVNSERCLPARYAVIGMRTFSCGGDVQYAGRFGFDDGGDSATAREVQMVTGFEPCVRPEPRARTKLDSG